MSDQNKNKNFSLAYLLATHEKAAVLLAVFVVAHILLGATIWFSPEINAALGYGMVTQAEAPASVAKASAQDSVQDSGYKNTTAPTFLSAF